MGLKTCFYRTYSLNYYNSLLRPILLKRVFVVFVIFDVFGIQKSVSIRAIRVQDSSGQGRFISPPQHSAFSCRGRCRESSYTIEITLPTTPYTFVGGLPIHYVQPVGSVHGMWCVASTLPEAFP